MTEINLEEELSTLDYRISNEQNTLVSDVIFSLSTTVYKVYNNHLYFSQEKGNTIGVIDLTKKKLVWYTKLEINSKDFIPIVTKMEFINNHLYILDSGNMLHVFENERFIIN